MGPHGAHPPRGRQLVGGHPRGSGGRPLTYLDTSLLVRLDLPEARTREPAPAEVPAGTVLLSSIARVEFHSALARKRRDGAVDADQEIQALLRFEARCRQVQIIGVGDRILERAVDVVGRRALRSLDAIHLATALVAAEGDPEPLLFGSLDARLNAAAKAEGLALLF